VNIGIRWTIGDVSPRGFQALALSIIGARRVFGPAAELVVCVNTISPKAAQARVGAAAHLAEWHDSTNDIPEWLLPFVDADMAQGVAWKFARVRMFADRHSLALDNDVILWQLPPAIDSWASEEDSLLIAEDVRTHYGEFTRLCPVEPRNSGIVGLPPRFDVESSLRQLLTGTDVTLRSETDEQGLQVAMVTRERHRVVGLDEVSISGYFRPHQLEFGTAGAHFVGVNAKKLPWTWNGRPGEEYTHGFWDSSLPEVLERLGLTAGIEPGIHARIAEAVDRLSAQLVG
jgi:hypothetical protein